MAADDRPVSAIADRALELHFAGVRVSKIAETLGVSVEDAGLAVAEALSARPPLPDDVPVTGTALEIARLDALLFSLWGPARKGEVEKVDRVLRILERRAKLLAKPVDNDDAFVTAYDKTVESSKDIVPGLDAALIESGRKIAKRVDEAAAAGDGTEVTKALYLVPHMLNILREMLATPASRTAKAPLPSPVEDELENLRSRTRDVRRNS